MRVIDINGVMPLPAERKRYFPEAPAAVVNRPKGPDTGILDPGPT